MKSEHSSEYSDDKSWFEVFRSGTHTDSNGHIREWTKKDLGKIASLYNPLVHEAPIVIGHPEIDSPAYGWIENLKVDGEKLLAKPRQVLEEFKDWVKRGMYKKVSIALYPDLSLRHIGFLGATPPAIKGLKPAAFSDKAAWTIEIDFFPDKKTDEEIKKIENPEEIKKGGNKMDISKFFSDLKTFVIGAEKELVAINPDRKFTEADIQAAEKRGKDITFAEMEKERKEKEEAQRKLKEIEDQKCKDDIAAFCEVMCKPPEGKLTPALRKIIEPAMIAVASDQATIEFVEASGVVKKSKLDVMKEFIRALPKMIIFSEIAGDDKTKIVPKDFDVAVQAVMTEKKFSRANAISFCAKEYPELHKEYIENLSKA